MSIFEELNGYEKGVTARAFLEQLIGQGRFGKSPNDGDGQEIIIPMRPWQLELLACFCRKIEVVYPPHSAAGTCCPVDIERGASQSLTAGTKANSAKVSDDI